jgi:hypothetical protein
VEGNRNGIDELRKTRMFLKIIDVIPEVQICLPNGKVNVILMCFTCNISEEQK